MSSYRFTSDDEPPEEELKAIMHEVAVEAKQKADKTHKDLMEKIKSGIDAALLREGFSS
jgi:hypothetical protein